MKKTVLVTGGAGGIGREFCKLFARDGYRLVVFSLSGQELAELGEELHRAYGCTDYFPVAMDLAAPEAANHIVGWLEDNRIEVDVLVNNVGVGLFGEHVEQDPIRLESMLTLNILLMSKLSLMLGKRMKERGEGYILNVASLAGFAPMPLFAAYSASKAYVISFSTSLARELKDYGVSVTCLCPSTTRTQFLAVAQSEHESSRGITNFVSAKIYTPDMVARAGYKALFRKRTIVLPSFLLLLQSIYVRLLSPRFVAWLVYKRATESAG